jgi:ribonuclease J
MSVEVIVHRGTSEIGGNCIEIRTSSTRIILDVGQPLFKPNREPYDRWETRGKTKEELLAFGYIPSVPGLFTPGLNVDAILLSHAHPDHTGLLPYTPDEIPVYASRGTSKMMLASSVFAAQVKLPRERHVEVIPGMPFQIGEMTVTGYDVDHSIFGCLAYRVEVDGKAILYTGDLRHHGRKPGMMNKLIEACREKQLDLIIVEGTNIEADDDSNVTEYELEEQITKQIADAATLVFACFSPLHVDRLVSFYKAARRNGRVFVADVYTAFVFYLLQRDAHLPSVEPSSGIRVYYPDNFLTSRPNKLKETLAKEFLHARIDLDEIFTEPQKYVMMFRPSMMSNEWGKHILDRVVCLHSRWAGYLDENDWAEFRHRYIDLFDDEPEKVGKLLTLHTSGHIVRKDLISLLGSINAKAVLPIHTFGGEVFSNCVDNVLCVKDGQTLLT